MNVEFSKLDSVNGVITIVAREDDFKDEIKKQMKHLAHTRQEPGFRAGHVPMSILEKKYGKAVRYDVIDKAISENLFKFIRDEKLRVLGNPVPDPDCLPNLDDAEMVFKFKVGLAPEIDLDVENVAIPYYNIKVSDEMIARQDESLRKRYGKQEPGDTVEPNALVKGVITELDAEGKPLTDGIKVDNGILSPEYFKSQEQKDLFVGKNVGAAVVFNPFATCEGNPVELSSMLHIDKAEVEQHKGNFQMDITEIIVLRPAQDGQEFYDQAFGADRVHNEEEYKEAVRAMIAAQLSGDSSYRFTMDARDAIMKAVGDIELPDAVLKDYLKSQNEELTDENVDVEYIRLVPGLKWQLVSDSLSRKLELKLTEEDLKEVAVMATRNQFMQYGMTAVPDDVLQKYSAELLKDQKTRESLATQAFEMKLFNAIRAKAKVEEKEVSVDEFNALFAPAPAPEAAAE